jgi:hypothetical protein
MNTITLRLPDKLLRPINDQHLIDQAFLEILAFISNKPIITQPPSSNIEYADYDQATRTVIYGDAAYGLRMIAEAISSGVGIHGERARWEFFGLPTNVSLIGYHVIDLRGGSHNEIQLQYKTDDAELRAQIEQQFAVGLRGLIGERNK